MTLPYRNLSSPIWDRIRIQPRKPLRSIADRLCLDAGYDPDLVRSHFGSRRSMVPGLVELRQRIVVALVDAGFTPVDIREQWFTTFSVATIRDYLVDGRKSTESVDA